jgi:hypothetical protein
VPSREGCLRKGWGREEPKKQDRLYLPVAMRERSKATDEVLKRFGTHPPERGG